MARGRLALYTCFGLLTLGVGLLLGHAVESEPHGERGLGFTSTTFRRERAAERRYSSNVSASSISDVHRALTRRPHRAGTEGAREVAQYIARELETAGLDVEVTEYVAYLSEPRSVTVEIVAPIRESLSVVEPADPRDADTAHPEIGPGFVAYAPSGDVTAPVIYVNYGLPADYAALKAAGVEVAGRIVLARYGRSHRAVKVFTAEQAGAVGVILYSDPADDGQARGATWPDGMWRTPDMLQRGNAKYSWLWHGDPLTPGEPATRNSTFLPPASAPTLPKIPVVVLSAREAERIWRLGPGAAVVRLQLDMQNERKPIRNVIGRIRGAVEPDRWVILGTHHDAWTFGGIDPGSSTAVAIEVARGLARLRRGGWQPVRSMMFAFWDAEEYGLIGSTEFAEERARDLQESAVVYINSDMYTRGRLVAGGVPSLRDFVAEVASATSAGDIPADLSALGSGADFVAFQDYLGVPTLALEFLFEGGYGFGAYHSSYDSRYYMENVADPGFAQGVTLARVLGVAIMRFAAAPVLPFRYGHYAERIAAFLQESEAWKPDANRDPLAVSTAGLRALAVEAAHRARAIERTIDQELASGRVPSAAGDLNDALARLEQALLDVSQPANRRWYRHVIYGWNVYSMYDGQPLPGLAEAIRLGDAALLAQEQARIQRALERMLRGLDGIAALLPDARQTS
jgi:N-acetylated-alpha-linked acidic dipeptidase